MNLKNKGIVILVMNTTGNRMDLLFVEINTSVNSNSGHAFSLQLLPLHQPRPQCFSLKKWVGWEKALASAGHVFYMISFLSQILTMVVFCFPPISMKGTASNVYETSDYRAV